MDGCSCWALVGSMGSLPVGDGRVFMQGAGRQYGQLTSR